MKKNKTWDGDGVLAVFNGYAYLQDISGRELGKTACTSPLLPGSTLSVGGKDVEVDSLISKEDFLAGKPFLGKMSTAAAPAPVSDPERRPLPKPKLKVKEEKIAARQVEVLNVAAPASKATQSKFKNPLLSNTVMTKPVDKETPLPRHDPTTENALVMKRPTIRPQGKQIVDVVVDPVLSKHLRDHQREGVQFLYECVMGMRSNGEGAILADEMGLGKTLQTIALLWTLLKQNPIYQEGPVVKKALIVCPAGLLNNWRREFRKWLGNERIGVFVVEGKNVRLADFTKGKAYSVMIIGYEMLRNVQEQLKKGSGIDIVIADEGHRLKTANNKAMLAIQSLNTDRRIILSGTPLQNDLSEFYTAIDFVNPGLLGKRNVFKKEFENPIMRGRQPEATAKDHEKGEARWQELVSIAGQFMIRRTADVLAKYLPPKSEYILFCKPTPVQSTVYTNVLKSPFFSAALGNTETALQLINILKKVCNSPTLLKAKNPDDAPSEMLASFTAAIAPSVLSSNRCSSKIRVLDALLHRIHTNTDEKVVIVSNYTSTLDIIGRLLSSLDYAFLRLDGSTPASKRQDLVERFNRTSQKSCFAFLLSAKSGGVGLNLIGASRLVLFDLDWNPATDLQAMARIHRDGQKKPCKIYRLLVQGALDEKIFQRQVTKQGLADAVVDKKASAASFSHEELRDLFSLDEKDHCQTHDLIGCTCEGKGHDAPIVPITSAELVLDTEPTDVVDSDEELPDLPTLLRASQVNMEEQEQRLKEQREARTKLTTDGKPKLRSLMQYQHLDPRYLSPTRAESESEGAVREDHVDIETLMDDDILLDILKAGDEHCSIGFVFAKMSS
ncbi:putative dsDNA-dependent ATPase [Lophium mytilinum]|uniref:Putative dsDNA-dependent ATPase n=1 Tax=Lophium mytilinum TaxID=390894 RepID=A0A6A6QYS6_9PEZI|nr:putative dsDNA-dependent ATPase [Lophium mytilinum]